MNKVILMGRLTRDPEVRYSQGENALAIVDTHWQLTAEISETTVMMSRLLTLSIVLLLEKAVNLRKSISTREPSL